MTLLVAGLLLWSYVHLFKRFSPTTYTRIHERFGESAIKGTTSILLIGAFVLMVFGYKAAPYIHVYSAPVWGVHLNNLLMLIAVFLLVASHAKGRVKYYLRHPMLIGTILWAAAHLLVNGDLASIVLFGWIAAWADLEIMMINVRDPVRVMPEGLTLRSDLVSLIVSILLFICIAILHGNIGPSPFPG